MQCNELELVQEMHFPWQVCSDIPDFFQSLAEVCHALVLRGSWCFIHLHLDTFRCLTEEPDLQVPLESVGRSSLLLWTSTTSIPEMDSVIAMTARPPSPPYPSSSCITSGTSLKQRCLLKCNSLIIKYKKTCFSTTAFDPLLKVTSLQIVSKS